MSDELVGESPTWRITTWNLQGAFGVDCTFVSEHIRVQKSSVFVVQEVTARQAKRLAEVLRMQHIWARKHTPFPFRSEGLAILTSHRLLSTDTQVITNAMPWSWRRRILLRARISDGLDRSVDVVNVHLSAHSATKRRTVELAHVLLLQPDVIAGDFNSDLTVLATELPNYFDSSPNGGPTCWTAGPRHQRPPTQRLDGIVVSNLEASDSYTPSADLDRWSEISDHLPVTVSVAPVRR